MAEKIHDKGYKRILSRKPSFLHLLHRYINASWLDQVTEQDLELIDKEFILKDFQEREADIVYKIRRKNGGECYVYVLLELQSSVDYTMPFRLLIYVTELLKRVWNEADQAKRERKSFRMPPVIPIVLYNGEKPWTAVRNFREYFAEESVFGDSLIDFRYDMIDVNNQEESFLLQMNTLLENVFLLDKSRDIETMERALKVTLRRLQKLDREAQIDLVDWIRDVLFKKAAFAGDDISVENIIRGLQKGDERMFTYGMERAIENDRKKVRQQGIEQGIERGRKEGRAEVALKLLMLNMDIKTIAEATGLTEEEIEMIKKLKADL